MKIIDVLNSPWAIEPTKLLEIQSIYATHLRGEKIDLAAVEQRLGRPLNNTPKAYDIVDGVAILPIEGVMAKRMNLFSQISGGTSTELIRSNLITAKEDTSVHSIILATDSPGGTVDGTQLLSDVIASIKNVKPIVTLASGTMASAAYWTGSAASQIYITDGTTAVGSIGVVTSHTDISASEAARGIKTTEITAGKYKRIASQYAPLSAEGLQTIQDQLDYMYSLFVSAVASNRGVSIDTVLSDMADGRIFIGQQAIDAGLVDGVSTLDALIVKLNQDRSKTSPQTKRAGAAQPINKGISMTITAEQVATDHPEIAAAFRQEGATAERERIQAIEAQTIRGHEALINTMKFDGKSSAGDAAMAIIAAEKTQRAAVATALENEAPAPVPTAAQSESDRVTADANTGMSKQELDAKAKEYMASNLGTSYLDAYKAVGGK
jgi:capsid assembly protease